MCEFGMSRNVVNLVLIDLRDYLMIVIFNCCIYLDMNIKCMVI